jgi:glycosyltransferase involved in cell wall biosynthesis
MRIGIDITSFSHGNSGIQVYLRNILYHMELLENDHKVYLFERRRSGYKTNNRRWKCVAVPLVTFPFSQTIWFQVLFPLIIKIFRIDVLWSPEYFIPLFLPKRVRVLLTVYDVTFLRFPKTLDRKLIRRFNLFFSSSLSRATKVTTISERIKKEIEAFFLQREKRDIVTVPCGKPSWKLPDNYDSQKREEFLITVGNFEPRKNHLMLFEALEILQRKGISIPLRIVGPTGWNNDAMHRFLINSSIKQNVSLVGYISESQLIDQYCSCKALVFPSFYEGFGMPVLEALSLDCLVATSKDTVMEEICENGALYFNPNDAENIASVIERIYRKEFDRKAYLQHRNRILEKYDWKASAKVLFEEIVR